jgi:hypothetical protein
LEFTALQGIYFERSRKIITLASTLLPRIYDQASAASRSPVSPADHCPYFIQGVPSTVVRTAACRFAPGGFPLWVSRTEPGSVHDLTAARIHALPALYQAAATGLPTLADSGYDGVVIGVHTLVK